MLTFIFAIGMAFATTDLKAEPEVLALDYYQENGVWKSVPEQNCQGTGYICRIQFGESGVPHDLYDRMDDPTPKNSGSPDPIVL